MREISYVLRKEANRFPGWFRERVDELASYSRSLSREREPSMNGDEEAGIPPEEIYSKLDAENALRCARP